MLAFKSVLVGTQASEAFALLRRSAASAQHQLQLPADTNKAAGVAYS